MTCYQRMHEVLLGVTRPTEPIDWDAILWDWMGVTSVHHRDHMLARMGVEPIDVYDFPRADLSPFTGLIVSGRVDQELLHRERAKVRRFLDDGKVVVFSGQLFRDWLPGAGACAPVALDRVGGIRALSVAPHPLFDGLGPDDLGSVFVHGHYRPPSGAQVVAALPGGEVVLYVDRTSSGGTIVAHAGGNLMGYVAVDSPAREIVPRLVTWINREARA